MSLYKRLLTLALAIVMALAFVAGARNTAHAADDLKGKLEIFSWWAGADGGDALQALYDAYKKEHPGVEVVNAVVAGGSGVNANAVLKTRMLGGDPPDSFQVHAGQQLIGTWVVADRMEPLDDLFKSEGWLDVFPKDLIPLLSSDGHIWSVPLNIHRSNVMWYIPENLKKWGIEAPKTWDEFLAACPKLQAAGVTPMAMGPNWTAEHLFESVLLGTLGTDGYNDLWAGKLKWTDDKVKNAWTVYGKVLDCTNKDASSLGDWVPAADLVIDGKAAFNVMGDWAAGYYQTTKKLEAGKDFAWSASPGTDGTFMALSDSFGLPKGAKDRDNTLAWLKLLGSKDGQDAFNPLKGSIAARKDSDLSKYSAYSKSAAADWAKDRLVGSLTHGVVAPESFMNDFATVIQKFVDNHDVEVATATAQQLADADMAPAK